jgi:hypothetical protein
MGFSVYQERVKFYLKILYTFICLYYVECVFIVNRGSRKSQFRVIPGHRSEIHVPTGVQGNEGDKLDFRVWPDENGLLKMAGMHLICLKKYKKKSICLIITSCAYFQFDFTYRKDNNPNGQLQSTTIYLRGK